MQSDTTFDPYDTSEGLVRTVLRAKTEKNADNEWANFEMYPTHSSLGSKTLLPIVVKQQDMSPSQEFRPSHGRMKGPALHTNTKLGRKRDSGYIM